MFRIVITGAESTGKTSLTKELARYFQAPYSNEFVREFVETIKRPIIESDLEVIFEGQLKAERLACSNNPPYVFHDTNLLSNYIYAWHYFLKVPKDLESEILKQNYTHYLLCGTDIPWVPDSMQRESQEVRDTLQQDFIYALREKNIEPTMILGTKKERLEIAIQAVQKIISADPS